MASAEVVIRNRTGLHARPAREFVNLAKTFQADVRVHLGPRKANGKSLASLLSLGVKSGTAVRIEATGADADAALAALLAGVATGLGDEHGSVPAPPAVDSVAPVPAVAVHPEGGAASGGAALPTGLAPATPGAATLARGVPAAPGLAIGPLHRMVREELTADALDRVPPDPALLTGALERARAELAEVAARMRQRAGAADAAVFEVHADLLGDPEILEDALARLARGLGAARAWEAAVETRAAEVARLDDPLLAARAADLRDVSLRVLRLLVGAGPAAALPDTPFVIVAEDLSPSQTAALADRPVLGVLTAAGGRTSHAAIIARALGLPSVAGAGLAVLAWETGRTVLLDGDAGTAELDPAPARLAEARAAQVHAEARRADAAAHADAPAVTRDGHRVEVVANVGGVEEARRAAASGAEGVGLLRTEFLFLGRASAPGEEEQLAVYREVGAAFGGRPVIIRTLDVGGDKPLPYVDLPREENPFLGERGIRLCLARPELLRQQLRAILRAASAGRLRIMFPMIADLGEWRAARALVRDLQAELSAPPIEVGLMVEVPSAALLADVFAAEADFMSIGSNDLTQYTLAMDRGHPKLAAQADGLHPAVLRLVERTATAAHAAGKWVGLCGELGADPVAVPILVGLGVDELSVNVPAIAAVKAQVRAFTLSEAREVARRALACATAAEVRREARLP